MSTYSYKINTTGDKGRYPIEAFLVMDRQTQKAERMLETYQMAKRGQVLCQRLTQGLTNLGFPWLSQAEQWHVPRGTWQTMVTRGSCYIE